LAPEIQKISPMSVKAVQSVVCEKVWGKRQK